MGVIAGAAVGATGKAALQLSSGTAVSSNRVALFGALGVGGDASLGIELSAANVTENSMLDVGLVAVGGNASASVTGDGAADVDLTGNVRSSRALAVQQQPVVTTVLDVLIGLGAPRGACRCWLGCCAAGSAALHCCSARPAPNPALLPALTPPRRLC